MQIEKNEVLSEAAKQIALDLVLFTSEPDMINIQNQDLLDIERCIAVLQRIGKDGIYTLLPKAS